MPSVVVWAILFIAGFVVAQSNTFGEKGMRGPQRELNAQVEFRSPLEKEVHRFIEEHPGISAEKITDFANSILKKEGYIYDFDTCEFIENRKLSPINPKQEQADGKIYLLPLELENGIQRKFEIGRGARRVTRHRYSRFHQGGFDSKSPRKSWPTRCLNTWRIFRKTPITIISDTSGSALKTKHTLFVFLILALKFDHTGFMTNNHKRAVIWDLDGTLIDSSAYHWEAWQAVMTVENFTLTYEQYVADFGKRNDEILRGRLGADLTDEFIARVSLAKEEAYRYLVRTKGLELLPGAHFWLERLKSEGWLQALGTSAPRGNIDVVFAALGIGGYFDVVMSSEEVKAGKPEPDVFLVAAQRMGVAPASCVVIEDAPAGIEAARRAGMKSIGVLTTHSELQADLVVPRLDQLPEDFF